MKCDYVTLMERNSQGNTDVLGEKSAPLPLCPPQIPHGVAAYIYRLSRWEFGD